MWQHYWQQYFKDWANAEGPSLSDTSCEESTKWKSGEICDLCFRKPLCKAETCNCHELQFMYLTLWSDHKTKEKSRKLLFKKTGQGKGKSREGPLERWKNFVDEAGNATAEVNKSAGSKNWKKYRWQERICEHFELKGAAPAACPKVCHL